MQRRFGNMLQPPVKLLNALNRTVKVSHSLLELDAIALSAVAVDSCAFLWMKLGGVTQSVGQFLYHTSMHPQGP